MPAQLEVRSEEIQEIMGAVPRKLIRWGSTVVFLVLIGVLTGAFFFPYPQVITARVRLRLKHSPDLLRNEASGVITTLSARSGRFVHAGSLLYIYQQSNGSVHRQKAPHSGVLQWLKPLQPGDPIEHGEALMAILDTSRQYVAMAEVSQNDVGEVKAGLPVTIALNAYPANEYGTVQGLVFAISPVPVGNVYAVSVLLPNGLRLRNKAIRPQQSVLWGTGQIITDQQRLLTRLFEKS